MNNKDYYKILGVEKNASRDEIKKAFRKLAHEHHPDKQGGNDAKFKEASEAYSVLGDAQKRAQYDRFGSNFGGMGGGAGGFQGGFNAQDFGGFDFSGFQNGNFQNGDIEFDIGDILGSFFGGARRARKGRNIRTSLTISFKESIFGTEKPISLGRENDKLSIVIPQGVDSGTTLRVSGRGEPLEGGQPGDLLVTIHVTPDKKFKKEGYHLVMDLPIPITTALLGGEQKIETLDGEITLKIPEGITHHELLRVKEKGVPQERGRRGDLYVRIQVTMPRKISREARKLIEALKKEGM